MDEFTKHFLEQSGGAVEGSGDLSIGPVYRAGFARGQRGRGLVGDFFRGVWSFVSPLFKTGAAALGKQALNTGVQILSDAAAGGPEVNFGTIAKKRLAEARDSMATKMRGAGKRSLKAKGKGRRQRSARTKMDIFSTPERISRPVYKRKR